MKTLLILVTLSFPFVGNALEPGAYMMIKIPKLENMIPNNIESFQCRIEMEGDRQFFVTEKESLIFRSEIFTEGKRIIIFITPASNDVFKGRAIGEMLWGLETEENTVGGGYKNAFGSNEGMFKLTRLREPKQSGETKRVR
ncbi:MAG: hypothetical protein P1V20_01275 [Verrucomicrobiales bacterium]|nr:hypothetical protein [Verrucomicrobiales bacterium]